MRAPGSGDTARRAVRRWPVAPQALSVFSEQVLERRIVEHGLGQQLLQPPVLVLQRLQPACLRYVQPTVLSLPLNGMGGSPSVIVGRQHGGRLFMKVQTLGIDLAKNVSSSTGSTAKGEPL